MKFTISLLALIFIFLSCIAQKQPDIFKVMAWNILHGANDSEAAKPMRYGL